MRRILVSVCMCLLPILSYSICVSLLPQGATDRGRCLSTLQQKALVLLSFSWLEFSTNNSGGKAHWMNIGTCCGSSRGIHLFTITLFTVTMEVLLARVFICMFDCNKIFMKCSGYGDNGTRSRWLRIDAGSRILFHCLVEVCTQSALLIFNIINY